MTICGRCGGNYNSFTCPNCKQIDAIDRQTKQQAKQFKMQSKMQGGGAGGSGIAHALAMIIVLPFQLAFHLAIQLYVMTAKAMFGVAKTLVKAAHDHNPEAFWRYVKWAVGIFFGTAFALAVLQNVVKMFKG